MTNPAYPNGQCYTCGFGLNEDDECTNGECSDCVFQWSDNSAVWQVEHGEADTPRTVSAFTFLEGSLNGGDVETCRSIGLRLLGVVEHFTETHNTQEV